MTNSSRRAMLAMIGGTLLSGVILDSALADVPMDTLGLNLTEAQLGAGAQLLLRHPSVDIHCHPGRFFLRNYTPITPLLRALGMPTDELVVPAMPAGHLSGAVFSGVADMALIGIGPNGAPFAAREFSEGEAWSEYERQIGVMNELSHRPSLHRGKSTRDIRRAQRRGRTANIYAMEGGDFIEDRLDRVHIAYRDGIRSILLIHYHVNRLGDIQTSAPIHGGLTRLGQDVVREMNSAGIIVDLAHATLATTRGVIDVSTRPVMLSHSNLHVAGYENTRAISIEHAQLVAGAGGIIGSTPWGIAQSSVGDWIDAICRLVDAVGVDHVAIGTDMDANFRPIFTDYRQWPLIPAALLATGMHEHEVAAIIGGNFMRIFRANEG